MKIHMILLLTLLFSISKSYPQFDLLEKIKDKAEEKIVEKTEESIDKSLENKNENSEEVDIENESASEEEVSDENKSKNIKVKNELKSYSKFDFIPGDKIIFYDDFSMEQIGDFPQKWNTSGSGEVVNLNNYEGNWFRLQNAVSYMPYLDIDKFGENFTVEVNFLFVVPENGSYGSFYIDFYSDSNIDDVPSPSSGPSKPGIQFEMHTQKNGSSDFRAVGSFIDGNQNLNSGDVNSTESKSFKDDEVNKLSFSFNKQRFRVYMNEKKVMDLPRILKSGVNVNRMNIRTWYWNDGDDYSILVKDVRIAEGQVDTRNQLLTEGKIVTRAISFDSGSDKIKPESYGILKVIADVLKENSSLKVKIIGHTDSDGSEDKNLDLSKRRAESVKIVLDSEFGIDQTRFEIEGKGENEPVTENSSSEGKASNRRVEFIKI